VQDARIHDAIFCSDIDQFNRNNQPIRLPQNGNKGTFYFPINHNVPFLRFSNHVASSISLLSEQPAIGRVQNGGECRTEFFNHERHEIDERHRREKRRGRESRFCFNCSDWRSLCIATFSCLSWFQPAIPGASLLIGQTIETVIRIQFIVTTEHSVFSPCTIGRSVVAVFNLSERRRGCLPQAVVDTATPIQSPVDVAGVWVIATANQRPRNARLSRCRIHESGGTQTLVVDQIETFGRELHRFDTAGRVVYANGRAVTLNLAAAIGIHHPRHPNRVGRSVRIAVFHFRCCGCIHQPTVFLVRMRLLTEVIVHILNLIQSEVHARIVRGCVGGLP